MGKQAPGRNTPGLVRAIYASRASEPIIKRRIETRNSAWAKMRQKKNQEREELVQKYQHQLKEIESGQSRRTGPALQHTRKLMVQTLKKEVAKCTEEKDKARNKPDTFRRIASGLRVFGEVGTLVVVNNLVEIAPKLYHIDSDVCQRCGTLFMFDHNTYMRICSHCDVCVPTIFVTEDVSQDVIVSKMNTRMSSSSTRGMNIHQSTQPDVASVLPAQEGKQPKRAGEEAGHGGRRPQAGQVRNTQGAALDSAKKTKIQAYTKFLQQFDSHQEEVPEEVLVLLYKQLSYVHLMSSSKCRPTPVAQILRKYGHQKFVSQVTRICRVFNGQEVPVLTDQVVSNLRSRYEMLLSLGEALDIKRYLSYELLTAVLLNLDGHHHLSQLFYQCKNPGKSAEQRIHMILGRAQRAFPDHNWELK